MFVMVPVQSSDAIQRVYWRLTQGDATTKHSYCHAYGVDTEYDADVICGLLQCDDADAGSTRSGKYGCGSDAGRETISACREWDVDGTCWNGRVGFCRADLATTYEECGHGTAGCRWTLQR